DRFFGPFTAKTWCLDVLGALNDRNRDVPAENHWMLLAEASEVRAYCCPTASLAETDRRGLTVSHKWFMISGRDSAGQPTATVEEIDFTQRSPQWRKVGDLIHPSVTSKAVVLPDGKVFIGQGLNRVAGVPFEQREGLRFQMFDPATGATKGLAK